MKNIKSFKINLRVWHRNLGYFLVGIMFIYALSGIVLIFRNTDYFKVSKKIEKQLDVGMTTSDLGKALQIKKLEISRTEGVWQYFATGKYNTASGQAIYTKKVLPIALSKLTQLHKSSTKSSLYWLNVFFGASLFFFVMSSFWMFRPKTKIYRRGMVLSMIGILFTIILIYL